MKNWEKYIERRNIGKSVQINVKLGKVYREIYNREKYIERRKIGKSVQRNVKLGKVYREK